MNKYNKIKKLLPFLLGVVLSFSSCKTEDTQIKRIEQVKQLNESQEEQVVEELQKNDEEEIVNEKEIVNEEEIIIDELTKDYINLIEEVKIIYNHEDLYLSNEYVDELISEYANLSNCNYKFDGNIENIIEKIKKNNINKAFFNEKEVQILNRLLNKILLNAKSDVNEDMHKLETISIIYGSTTSVDKFSDDNFYCLAYYDESDNTIYINDKLIKTNALREGVSYYYYLEYILEHDLNHIRQTLCDCRVNDNNLTRLGYDKFFTFLLESSAETSIYQEQSSKRKNNYTYSEERIRQSQLLLLAMFKQDSIDEFFKNIYDVNLNGLLSYLDIKDDEVYDLYKIIYAMDAFIYRNDMIDNIYDDKENVSYEDICDEIGFTYKEHLFKLVLIRLLEYNSQNEMKLEDNLTVYYLLKNIIMYDCFSIHETDTTLEKVYPSETINNIYLMDSYYIEYLSHKYNISVEEIRKIEGIEGYLGAKAIKEYILEGKIIYEVYQEQADRILDSFPLLKYIVENYDNIFLNDYKKALNKNNILVYEY